MARRCRRSRGSTKRPAGGITSSVPPAAERVVGPVGEAPVGDPLDGDAQMRLVRARSRSNRCAAAPRRRCVARTGQMLARLEAERLAQRRRECARSPRSPPASRVSPRRSQRLEVVHRPGGSEALEVVEGLGAASRSATAPCRRSSRTRRSWRSSVEPHFGHATVSSPNRARAPAAARRRGDAELFAACAGPPR